MQDHVHRSCHPLLLTRNEIKKRDQTAMHHTTMSLHTTMAADKRNTTTADTMTTTCHPSSVMSLLESTVSSLPAKACQQQEANLMETIETLKETTNDMALQEQTIDQLTPLTNHKYCIEPCPFEIQKQDSISFIEQLNKVILEFPTLKSLLPHIPTTSHKYCVASSSQSILIEHTNMKDCLDFLTDFEKYPQIVEGIHSATVTCHKQDDHTRMVHMKSTILFSTLEYDIKVTRTREGISFTHVSETSPFKSFTGGWKLENVECHNNHSSNKNDDRTTIRATYFIHMEIEPQVLFKVPLRNGSTDSHGISADASLYEWLSNKNVPTLMRVMKKHIEEYSTRKRVKEFHIKQKQLMQQSSMLFL
ncbi:hypothetical protein C9374_011171 [Naegleria lovaniensis]|uniref:Coenzyme Q-binding protein COQ10 START domain-containing protein n=1 Tax=Naegleria lovaniensis TaxID=51637 RepID=A0AA88KIM4_NAELO|nr:uncharacterized protein C9374_011171 [Naegleria lovaniensis]KAG2374092.1 hypothetical protein C9374_011171 [Naegleria lovaniensis]